VSKELKLKITPLKMKRDRLLLLNQILLPRVVEWVECFDAESVSDSIKKMHVRGAPAIGIAAAYGFYLGVKKIVDNGEKVTPAKLNNIKTKLDKARPTAVNLSWATSLMLESALNYIEKSSLQNKKDMNSLQLLMELYNKAVSIHEDDAVRCLQMSERGADYIVKKRSLKKYRIMTHCNAGALATGGIGTALGLIRVLQQRGLVEMVYSCETRPYLQGARLTAYELDKEKIPVTLIADSMAAVLMQKKMIDFIIVGADRITKNGDAANKIGTYSHSVNAKLHKIPFYVIAPKSTLDNSITKGDEIIIENRDSSELLEFNGVAHAAKVKVLNYSFDVTPRENIEAIFFEDEVI